MSHHAVDHVLLLTLGGTVVFILAWYLLGMGIGIAQRGYNRVAPYRITTKVEPPPTSYRRSPHSWEDWDSRR